MSNEEVKKFGVAVRNNPKLQDLLKNTRNHDDFVAMFVSLGKENGFNFTAEDVNKEMKALVAEQKRLTAEELESLAAGGSYDALLGNSAWTFKSCGAD